ncbi:30S ribosomal protein S12 methylthiotransferase RimO [Thermodesulfobacteriota bacterium]
MAIIYLETLGCAKNQVDSEVMLGYLTGAGHALTTDPEAAEIIVVNTCAFIEEATRQAIETILLLAAHKQSGACRQLIVCGCLPQRYKQELLQELPEVDLFLGAGEYPRIARHIEKLAAGKAGRKLYASRPAFLVQASSPRELLAPGSSAYIKIAEGCSHRCTFCAIPSIKGPYRQRSAASITREAALLARNGIREINLVSQDTTRYAGLPNLLKKLIGIPEIKWIRLLYCHPRNLTGETIRMLAGEEKLCSYIDIPLQHIADPVLKRMGRRTSRKHIESLMSALRSAGPDIAIRTTFIVGFPGETDRDFEQLLAFAAGTQFEHLGAFQYRDEEGTPGSRLGGKVPETIKRERYRRLMRQQAPISRKKNRRFVRREIEVLVDGISPDENYSLQARSRFQAPEVDGVIYLNDDVPIGAFARVRITKARTYDLVGKLV